MKRILALSLIVGVYAIGCTIEEKKTDTNDPNADAGPVDPGTPDGGPTDTDSGPGTDPTEIEEAPGNDSLDTAQAVPVGSKVSAKMTGEEEDFFSFQLADGAHDGVLSFTLDEADPDFVPGIAVYTSGKTEYDTWYANDGTTRPFKVEFNATAGKLYYVKVFNGHAESTVPYTLESSFTAVPDAFERNDSFDTAKPAPTGEFDLYMFAGIDTNGGDDEDFFKIDMPTTGTPNLRIKVTNKSTAELPQIHGVTIHGTDKREIEGHYAAGEQADLDHTFDLTGITDTSVYIKFFNAQSSPVASKATISFE